MAKQKVNLSIDVDLISQLKRLNVNISELCEEAGKGRLAILNNEINYFDLVRYEKERKALQDQQAKISGQLRQLDSIINQIQQKTENQKALDLEQQKIEASRIKNCVLCNCQILELQKKEKSFSFEDKEYFHHTECSFKRYNYEGKIDISGYNKLNLIKEDIPTFLKTFFNKILEGQK
jgi:hypothetical protein